MDVENVMELLGLEFMKIISSQIWVENEDKSRGDEGVVEVEVEMGFD